MKCFDPVLCYANSKGKQYRHFSLASPIFKQIHQQVFDCGQCLFCRKKRAYELACRCVLHSSLYDRSCFLTLTYDETKSDYHNNFNYPDIQKFKKDLRQAVNTAEYTHLKTLKIKRRRFPKWLYKKIEIFNVHEYGKNGKKHWHLIVFNHDFQDKTLFTMSNGIPLYTSKRLEELWPHGYNTIGDVSTASAMYQAQYVEKDFKHGNRTNKKRSHSKHSGIGGPYFLKNYEQLLTLGYVPIDGKKLPLPRYFQKLAHKHYCHFYEKSAFQDLRDRKALYRPFKTGLANKKIADLYIHYQCLKEEKIKEMELEWNETITTHLTTKQKPDFIKSHENAMHDLTRSQTIERF